MDDTALREELGPKKWRLLQHKLRMNGKKAKRSSFTSDVTEAQKTVFRTETNANGAKIKVPYDKMVFCTNSQREQVPDWRVCYRPKLRSRGSSPKRTRNRLNFKNFMRTTEDKAAARAAYCLRVFKQNHLMAELRKHGLTWRAAEIEAYKREEFAPIIEVAAAVVQALNEGKGKEAAA